MIAALCAVSSLAALVVCAWAIETRAAAMVRAERRRRAARHRK